MQIITFRLIYTKILSQYVDSKYLKITYNNHGKPVLYGNSSLFFSVSHTLNTMMVAVALHNEVGIDIEISTRKIYKPLFRRFIFDFQHFMLALEILHLTAISNSQPLHGVFLS